MNKEPLIDIRQISVRGFIITKILRLGLRMTHLESKDTSAKASEFIYQLHNQ